MRHLEKPVVLDLQRPTNVAARIVGGVRSYAANALLVALLALAPFLFESHIVGSLTRGMIYGMAACAVGFIIRCGGMVSFGHAAYFGLGAYSVLIAQKIGLTEALLIWPIAVLVSAAASLAIGSLSLRTRGVSFIMITLGFAQMVYFVISSVQGLGGADGLGLQARNQIGGVSLESPTRFHFVVLALLLVVFCVLSRVGRSPLGMALAGIRQNERRLKALGYNTTRLQLTAFVLSAAITGLAGALAAEFYLYVSPGLLHWIVSGELLVMATLGGVTALMGGLFGALVLLLAEVLISEFTTYWRMALGPVVIVAVLYLRQGLQPALQKMLGGGRD
ncbi:branched-chain amino acid ABC transporter permease [Microvirga alba]|uniref:Branched-chain amino acid ABC transporter permease n=1 Tax=Microvirga alba TaxID=2791025 RepID=A0A931BRT2_9HYPH|nr:branched-chain amino acid ABC transporter permease [Microvirga alba]MBF9234853.1 branched-chain amino acid ABC transporter permease [Microvirga alba]